MAGASSPAPATASLRASRSRRHGKETTRFNIFKNPTILFAFTLFLGDAILVALIIAYVPYTKINWDAYMSQEQVSGFLGGRERLWEPERCTGPLVYSAGFLYVNGQVKSYLRHI